jgi:hypothetical protein
VARTPRPGAWRRRCAGSAAQPDGLGRAGRIGRWAGAERVGSVRVEPTGSAQVERDSFFSFF